MILLGPGGPLAAKTEVPPSKSATNRALAVCAAAGGGEVVGPLDSDDTRVLAAALAEAGWPVSWQDGLIRLDRRTPTTGRREIWLADSGTGARLMLAVLAATPGRFVLDGSPRLRERPMAPLLAALGALGARCRAANGDQLPISIDGRRLAGGAVSIRPEVSSQFVSALMVAAPLTAAGLDISVAGPLPSRPYLDLTVDMLERFGGVVHHAPGSARWRVASGGLRPATVAVEGDWSAAAFFAAAAAVAGGWVEIRPLALSSRQGDRRVCAILEAAGAHVREVAGGVCIKGPIDRPIVAELLDAPDLFPALAAAASVGRPGSRISGLDHLRHKESDRLTAMVNNLRGLGAELSVAGSVLHVARAVSVEPHRPRPVTAAGDHRIAMALAVVALAAGPLRLDDPLCVSKSFPSFWKMWNASTSADGLETPSD